MVLKFRVSNGTFGYRKDSLLFEDINLTIEDGEILTILGANGVGKTTLLKCMMGFLKWHKGETLINEKSFNSFKSVDVWKRISYVPQAKITVFPYSVIEMVLMGRNPHMSFFSMPKQEDIEKSKSVMEELNILKLENKVVSELSGGELQMVLMARALVSEPEVLILDEPESNLDIKNQLIVLDVIQKMSKQKNITCIINTHYPEHALRISDKTLIFSYGNNYIYGKTSEIVNESNIKRFYEVESKILEYTQNKTNFKTILPLRITDKVV